jgi:hypothetical protein
VNFPFFSLLLFYALNRLIDTHAHYWRKILLFQSIDSNANLFQKHPHRHIQKQCVTSYMNIINLFKFTHKINHHMRALPQNPQLRISAPPLSVEDLCRLESTLWIYVGINSTDSAFKALTI